MPDVMTDRRAAPRYSFIVVAEVTEIASGAKLNARTSDVSRTGCYVDTLHPTPAGTTIRLRLTHLGEYFETQAKVVYVSPGLGMGVLFQDTAPDQLALLDRWLMVAAKNS